MIRRGSIVVAPTAKRYGNLPGPSTRLFVVDHVLRDRDVYAEIRVGGRTAILLPYPETGDCPAEWEAMVLASECRVATPAERAAAVRGYPTRSRP